MLPRAARFRWWDRFTPHLARLVTRLERRVLADGLPLLPEEMTDARAVGVSAPERVRLLCLARVPAPADPVLRAAAAALQFFTPQTRGLSLRYAIFIRRDCWRDRALIAHELAHTAQYERMGGIEPFLREYLSQCAQVGYPAAPLEQEAIAVTRRLPVSQLSKARG